MSPRGEERFLAVENLTVGYGGVIAVDDVSFDVRRGEHVTLLGPSGCGKTTTLRSVAGLEQPQGGRIVIDGAPVYDAAAGRDVPPEQRSLSMVFQSYAIWPHMTVFDNVAFGFRVRGIGRDKSREAVERALSLVGLAAFAGRSATKLSGGQQQRVALARAIAFDSKVILFDEPLSNLDAQLRISMRAELGDLRRRLGFTSIYVTHDQEEAFALSDRIIIMRAGKIEQQGTPTEIHAAPRTRFVAGFLGVKNVFDADIAAMGAGAARATLAGGLALAARESATTGRGGKAAICFRPMDVRLASDVGQVAGIAGTVTRALFLGDLAHYYVRSGEIEICAYDRPRPELAEGRAVRWQIAPENCQVLWE